MEKYEKVLLAVAKKIKANNIISKGEIVETSKEEGMELTNEEVNELSKKVRALHRDINVEKEVTEKVSRLSREEAKISQAIASFKEREPTLITAPSILKEVIEDFALSKIEIEKMKKIVKEMSLSSLPSSDGGIEQAYSRLRKMFIESPSTINISVINKIADEEGVNREKIKAMYKKRLPSLIKYRRETPVIIE